MWLNKAAKENLQQMEDIVEQEFLTNHTMINQNEVTLGRKRIYETKYTKIGTFFSMFSNYTSSYDDKIYVQLI